MRPKIEIPMLLEGLPTGIRLPMQDLEKIAMFLGVLFAAIGGGAYLLTSEDIAGFIFMGIGALGILYALFSYVPYAASAAKNKAVLISPVKKALENAGYHLSNKKILMMWSEGSIKSGPHTFFAGARQGPKFVLTVM